MTITLADITAARDLLQGIVRRTPVEGSRPLSHADTAISTRPLPCQTRRKVS